MKHLLVTNDFPPKIGGIQSYLWELWRRLPAEVVTVLTTPHLEAREFDSRQSYRLVRTKQKWLLPTLGLAKQINELADEVDAEFIVLDPVFPLGLIASKLNRPYVLIGHGAEFTIPMRFPFVRQRMTKTVQASLGVIGGGAWVERAMRNASLSEALSISIPPGVDTKRFDLSGSESRMQTRESLKISEDQILVLGVSRLVSRKGFDRLIRASAELATRYPQLRVLIAGGGRQEKRLSRLIRRMKAPVTMLGRVPDEALPALYAAADVFCMPCHARWFGFEQEGFGIVFVEAAAAGVPSVAGHSGGSDEAVIDGETGFVVGGRVSARDIGVALESLIADAALRRDFSSGARRRAVEDFDYDKLAVELSEFLKKVSERAGRRG